MNSKWVIIIGAILYLLVNLYCLIKAVIKGDFKYELKSTINSVKLWVVILWSMYAVMGGVSLAPIINTWTVSLMDKATSESGVMVISWIPTFYVGTLIYILIKVILSANKPLWKYTDAEMVKLEANKKDNRRRLHKLLPFIKDMKE